MKRLQNTDLKKRKSSSITKHRICSGSSFSQLCVYIIAIALFALFAAFKYKSESHWLNGLLNSTVPIILASVGQSFVLFVHGIDLSVAGLISFANCLTACYIPEGPIAAVIFIIMLIILGVASGFVNGYIITRFNLPPFIVTFAMWFIWEGLAHYIAPIKTDLINIGFAELLTGNIFFVPVSLILIAALIIAWIYIKRTRFGISLYAIDHNKKTAYYSGIDVTNLTVAAYMICGAFAAAAGIYVTAQTNEGAPSGGDSYLLLTLCAVFLGGADFKHNKGGIFGTIAGCFILQLLIEIIMLAGVPIYWAQLIRGLILIFIIFIRTAFRLSNEKA